MRFAKMHGAGNDYVVVDARQEGKANWSRLAKELCHRRFGVGADGLLLVAEGKERPLRMRMFNPDGSEAEMCGNGIRCFTKYVVERGIASKDAASLEIETLDGLKTVTPLRRNGIVTRVKVNMGEPRFRPTDIPVVIPEGDRVVQYPLKIDDRSISITCVSMGNPHAVAFLEEDVASFPLEMVGPLVERHPLFPQRVNFEIVNHTGQGRLKARVWERGVGETLACGTGACAIAVASQLLVVTDGKVDITLPGDVLTVEWRGQGPVWLEGPVEEVFLGEWERNLTKI